MTILKIVANALGLTGTGYLLYSNIGGWYANVLWITMACYWVVQLARALVRLYFEIKDQQLEYREKKARYNKDIFT